MKISEVIELLEEIKKSKGDIEIGIWKDDNCGFEGIEKENMCITEILHMGYFGRSCEKTLVIGKMATEDDEEALYEPEEE